MNRSRYDKAGELTPQELTVMANVIQGLSNNAIAQKLSLSCRTVESHCASIYRKLSIRSRSELSHWYYWRGGRAIILKLISKWEEQ